MFGKIFSWRALIVGSILTGWLFWSAPVQAQVQRDPQEIVDNLQKAFEKLNRALQKKQGGLGGIGGIGGIGGMPGMPGLEFQQQLVRRGKGAGSGRLGATVDRLDPALVEQLDIARDQGLVLRDLQPEGAAAKAGLKTYDILWEFNGQKVAGNPLEFARQLDTVKADQAVDAVVLRKGKQETIKGLKLPEAKAAGRGGFVNPGFKINPGARPGANKFNPAPPAKDGLDIKKENGAFITRYKEEQVTYTITGKIAEGKAQADNIHIRDGKNAINYGAIDQVPEEARRVVEYLLRLTEKKE